MSSSIKITLHPLQIHFYSIKILLTADDLTFTNPQTEVNDLPIPPEVVDFINRNYQYRSVASYITQYAGLAPTPYIG